MATESQILKLADYLLLNTYSIHSPDSYKEEAEIPLCLFKNTLFLQIDNIEGQAFELLKESLLTKNENIGFENDLSLSVLETCLSSPYKDSLLCRRLPVGNCLFSAISTEYELVYIILKHEYGSNKRFTNMYSIKYLKIITYRNLYKIHGTYIGDNLRHNLSIIFSS